MHTKFGVGSMCFRGAVCVLLVCLSLNHAAANNNDTTNFRNQSITGHVVNFSATAEANNGSCPGWLLEYEQFHVSMRGQPAAKYLVHEVSGVAGGLGDRLRGMMFSVRLAYALKRVVLFTWKHPADISAFLQPPPDSQINWKLEGIQRKTGKRLHMIDSTSPDIRNGALNQVADEFITLVTNAFMDTPCQGCPDMDPWSADAVCLWHKLFLPSEAILTTAAQRLRQAYSTSIGPKYVAVHLRLGGLTGEHEVVERGRGEGRLVNLLAALDCAMKLAIQNGIDTKATPVLMATDNHHLRTFLMKRHLADIVTPGNDLPVHLDRGHSSAWQHHQSTFVDMVLLGGSTCFVTSQSGFSHQAWLWGGGKPCRVDFTACLPQAGVKLRKLFR